MCIDIRKLGTTRCSLGSGVWGARVTKFVALAGKSTVASSVALATFNGLINVVNVVAAAVAASLLGSHGTAQSGNPRFEHSLSHFGADPGALIPRRVP